jgi:hypothetical protein
LLVLLEIPQAQLHRKETMVAMVMERLAHSFPQVVEVVLAAMVVMALEPLRVMAAQERQLLFLGHP